MNIVRLPILCYYQVPELISFPKDQIIKSLGEGSYGTVVKAKRLLVDANGGVIRETQRALKFSGGDDASEAMARAEADILIEICKIQQKKG